MDLGIAGALSGAGEAGSRSLSMAQAQFGASQLQAERDKMDDLRQTRLLEAQRAMHTETLQATASEGAANRKSAEGIHANAEEQANVRSGMGITSSESTAELGRQTQEKISSEANASHERIAAATNRVHKQIADAKHQIEKETNTKAEMTTLAKVMGDAEHEITRLKIELLDPLKNDPKDPQVKLLRESLAQAEQEKDAFRARYQELTGTKPVAKLAPFKSPTFGATPGIAQTPGTRTVPAPSSEVQDQMRKSLVP